MDVNNLIFIVGFVVLFSLIFFLSIRFRDRFWGLFGTVLPFLLGGIFLFNLISFEFRNRPYFNWAYEGVLQRLPSDGMVDLYASSGTPIKPQWIYIVIETYYQGKTLTIPETLVEGLELSIDLLESQAQLDEVVLVKAPGYLSPADLEEIMALDQDKIQTQKLDSKGNVTREAGDIYHFIDAVDPQEALVLLRYQDSLFFVPESVLPELEGEN